LKKITNVNKEGAKNMKNGELTFMKKLRLVGIKVKEVKWIFVITTLVLYLAITSLQSQATDQYVTIVISPVVKQKLQQTPPSERKKIEKAIKSGNKLMQLRFNEEDLGFVEDPDGEARWNKKMAPIVMMGMEDWEDYRNNRWEYVIGSDRNHSGVVLVNCMQIKLAEITSINNGTDIKYTTTLLGKFPYISTTKGKQPDTVDLSVAGKSYEILLHADKLGRINSEYSTEKYSSQSYDSYKNYLVREKTRLNKILKINNAVELNNIIKVIDHISSALAKSVAVCKHT
jgi:hypothetical protein